MSKALLSDPISLAKRQLRKTIAQKIEELSREDIARQSEIVTHKILNATWFTTARRISIYLNTDNEVCTESLVKACFNQGKDVFIPQFRRGDPRMRMLHLTSLEHYRGLPTTLWNIRQPSLSEQWEEYSKSGPLNVVLLPGVAFTSKGERLGHGKGFYDRFLCEHVTLFGKKPLTVGLALEEQIVDDLPTTDLDVRLDYVISKI